jgi:peptidoglycan/xylan/chitin deacetylase (PgdA/CDA1 family)
MRRQDLSVLLLYFLGYSRVRNLLLRLRHDPVARFVTFHDLLPETLACFEAKLHFLSRNTNVVSLDDFFLGKLSWEKINVVITFDDGYKSWILDAVPVLKKLKMPATFFVSSGFVGLSEKEEVEFIKSKLFSNPGAFQRTTGGLSFNDVKRISEEGFTIGGHTVTHCNLKKMLNNNRLRYEIGDDKLRLERIIGRKIHYFAYPSGAYHNPAISVSGVLKEMGYRGAVTTVCGFNSMESDPYLLHRDLTDAPMPKRIFQARVYGNSDPVRFLKQCAQVVFQR